MLSNSPSKTRLSVVEPGLCGLPGKSGGLVPSEPLYLDGGACPVVVPSCERPGLQAWQDRRGRICAYCHVDEGVCWLHLLGVASFSFDLNEPLDEVRAYCTASRHQVLDKYRRTVAPLALQVLGHEVLHASAVESDDGIVAFCGHSGTGKTTMAYGLATRGWPLWADDTVIFNSAKGACEALPMPFECRLRETAAEFFSGQKALIRQSTDWLSIGSNDHARTSVRAVFVLGRTSSSSNDGPVMLKRLSCGDALGRVMAHANCFDLQSAERLQKTVHQFLALLTSIPVYDLQFSPSFKCLPEVIDCLEELIRSDDEFGLAPATP